MAGQGKLFAEKLPTIAVSAVFFVIGLFFVVLNFTKLPIFGMILGIVFFLIGGFILVKFREGAHRGTPRQGT